MTDQKAAPTAVPAKRPTITIDLLFDGAKKACHNAEALFNEAKLLADHGGFARALCLHQISLEECSKVEHLGAWSMSLLRGGDVNPRQMAKVFSSHAAKNKLNAYMLEFSEAELAAWEKRDWEAAGAEFKKTQEDFHKSSNNNKNAALYVDWTGKEFVAPEDAISAELAAELAGLNARFLDHAKLQLRMFERLESDGDILKPELTKLIGKLDELSEASVDDRIAGADAAMSDFLTASVDGIGKK